MSKAEKEAIKRYPKAGLYDNLMKRKGFIEGYHQAEKDLELTWEDIEKIDAISIRLDGTEESKEMSGKEFYQEVLKRFKEYKEATTKHEKGKRD